MYRFVVLAIFVSGALGQVIKNGVCNYGAIGGFVTDLNFTGIFGSWNQIARIDNEQELGDCSSATFQGKYDASGALTGVEASHLEVVNKTKVYHNGSILAIESVNGLFYMNFTGFFEGDFVVQSTNYTDYAILYTCYTLTVANAALNITDTKLVMAWQYHRKAQLSSSEQASIQGIVNLNPDLNGISWRYVSHNSTACGNDGVSLAVPHVLIFLATLFISKEFV